MKIPSKVKVGRQWYTVQEPEALKGKFGDCNYTERVIRVAKNRLVIDPIGCGISNHYHTPYTVSERDNTFWHELVHAILHDMDSRRARDEIFVSRFANRLTEAINTAVFEEKEE